ncbi:hypothetical protein LT42_10935 [Pseudomonas lutea]|uniref:Uncharacterized protein n=1 Tax=Pseudomonas lutea TaxID=243924 RepID=A0A9X0EI89_9PSED|nr:hypothetical protein LT42_10935 [Pseudomonas lutea]
MDSCVSDTAFAGKRAPTVDSRNTGDLRRTRNRLIRCNTGQPSAYAEPVDPGNTGDLFGVRKTG